MDIVISAGPGAKPCLLRRNQLINAVLKEWVLQHPDHQFYFLNEGEADWTNTITAENLQVVPLSTSFPFYKWRWYNKVSALVKKIKPAAFISLEPVTLPIKNLSQYALVSHFALKSKKLNQLSGIISLSGKIKEDLVKHGVPENKITVVYGGAKQNVVLNEEEKTSVKEQYTDGKEYFLLHAPLASKLDIVQILKGFSIFKKRQKTTMRLVLIGKEKEDSLEQLLNTYKYKEDVVWIDSYLNEEKKTRLLGSAYAIIDFSKEKNVLTALDTMASLVPLLTPDHSCLKEIADEAALYFNEQDTADIAEKLMLIYKDEALRTRLIEEGYAITQQLTWGKTAEIIWHRLQSSKK